MNLAENNDYQEEINNIEKKIKITNINKCIQLKKYIENA